MLLRQVIGTFNYPDGTPVINSDVSFTLGETDGFNTSNFIVKNRKVVKTDNSGSFAVYLWVNEEGATNTYYLCKSPSGDTFTFRLPAGSGSINLTVLRAMSPPTPAPPNTQQIIEDYLAAQSFGTVVYPVSIAATVWTVTHNLGRYPSVTTIDSANRVIMGDVQYIDDNRLTVTFAYLTAGTVYLN